MPVDGHNRLERLQLRAPAKVNLFLEVRGKRRDGYHDLRMFMAPVSLFDRLALERLAEPGRVSVWCQGDPAVRGGKKNLCFRAAKYYFAHAGVSGGVRIRVVKAIPSGAGLGGGSTDAAVTLLGLERLFGRPLLPAARSRVAFEIGADVPFFFSRSAAWVEGIGESVRPSSAFEPLWLVLVYPGVVLSTAKVFSRWNPRLTTPNAPHTIPRFDFRGFVEGLRNDLQQVAAAVEPRVEQALRALAQAGSSGSLMSGSGSAVFGLFPDEVSARTGAARVRAANVAANWRVEVVCTLPPGAFPFREPEIRTGA